MVVTSYNQKDFMDLDAAKVTLNQSYGVERLTVCLESYLRGRSHRYWHRHDNRDCVVLLP
jgi:hypothetical protein